MDIFGNKESPEEFEQKDIFKYYVNAKMIDFEDIVKYSM